jgi:Fe-S cluster assembly protein SufD
VELARGARLEHYRLQELNASSTIFDTLSAGLAADAAYRLHGISTGAQSARSTLALRLTGERADLCLAVAALGCSQQVQDAYAVVEHAAPNARTVETFRGIAAGRARVAFNGKIIVAPGARGTDSRQSLRGLLAGPEAEIDVRPQLEIYNDDVRCSHGATAGKLDDDMLFYLLSRGLDREAAQRLLKWAFLEDVIAQIALRPLRRQIEERLAVHLRDDALRELL